MKFKNHVSSTAATTQELACSEDLVFAGPCRYQWVQHLAAAGGGCASTLQMQKLQAQ